MSLGFCSTIALWASLVAQTVGKASACNAGDLGSIPGSGRSPGERHGNPLQYSCLENPMDGGAWRTTVHRVAKSQTRLSYFTFTFFSPIRKNSLVFLLLMLFSHSVVSNSCNPMDSSPPGSFVHGISQARILEWVAISFSRDFWGSFKQIFIP